MGPTSHILLSSSWKNTSFPGKNMIRVLVGGWRADLASQTTPHSVEVSRNWSKTRAGSTLSPSFRVPDSTVQKPHPLSISSLFPLWGRDQVVRIVLFVFFEKNHSHSLVFGLCCFREETRKKKEINETEQQQGVCSGGGWG